MTQSIGNIIIMKMIKHIRFFTALMLALSQTTVYASNAVSADDRNYEVTMKSTDASKASSILISTISNRDATVSQTDSINYTKSCDPGANYKVTTATLNTGYKLTISPEDTNKLTLEWSISNLVSLDHFSANNCTVDLPNVSKIGGKLALDLAVGELSEFTGGKYLISVKRIN